MVTHLQNMSKTAKPAEDGVHSGETITSQHFLVCNTVLPPNSENTTEAPLVEGVNFLLLLI